MLCPVCPAVGWIGGLFGGYFGINPPKTFEGKIFSAAATASLMTITVISMKVFFNLSFCIGGSFDLKNIIRVASQTFVLGIIYSIGVNYIINHHIYETPVKEKSLPKKMTNMTCCCKDQN